MPRFSLPMSADGSQKQVKGIDPCVFLEEGKSSTDLQLSEALQLAGQISELKAQILETRNQMIDLINQWNAELTEMKSQLDRIEQRI
jgi:hypothetical protein